MLLSHHFLGIGNLLFLYSRILCVGLLFILEVRVSLEAVTLSLRMETRFVYIPTSPNITTIFDICEIYGYDYCCCSHNI
ncbi:hypothetical protein Hanom_Chr10g00952741 [Helianthus anomalus]